MELSRRPVLKTWIAVVFTLLLTAYQLVRVIHFAGVYGGIEHDSGWFLGVSRQLAESGSYATMVSTLADPGLTGGIDVDGKFNVQDEDGRILFFTVSGTGPASIVPDALAIKLFGAGFWALRAGPLLFFALFLVLAAWILYQMVGLGGILLFHAYLFFYPRLSIFLSYEAFGEVPAMSYVLAALVVFWMAQKRKRGRVGYYLACGLLIGLAVNAKLIALFSVAGILVWAAFLWLSKSRQVRFLEGVLMVGGAGLVLAGWEMIQMAILTRLAGWDIYTSHLAQRFDFILDDGSGLRTQIYSGTDFLTRKFALLAEIAGPTPWQIGFVFVIILLGGLVLLWLWRSQPAKQTLLACLWIGWLVNIAWFVAVAKTGWIRHFWFGLVLGVMVLCAVCVGLLREGTATMDAAGGDNNNTPTRRAKWGFSVAGLVLLALIGWGFSVQPHVMGFFLPEKIVPYWQTRQATDYLPGAGLPWIIVPRSSQEDVVSFVNLLPPESHVYYPANQKAAEVALLTGRIFYPLERRGRTGTPAFPQDIVLVSPSTLTPWRDPGVYQGLLHMADLACPNPVLKNDAYWVCLADQIVLP